MQMNTGNQNNDLSSAKELKKHLTKEHHNNGVINQGKYRNIFMEIKWTDRQYHVHNNANIAHKDVILYCNTNKTPALPFCGPHSKPHDERGLSKHYHLCFDTKLGSDICAIRRISCACVKCTPMLDKHWISGIPPGKQEHYKPVTNCTYWTILGSFNNWNIIQL